LIYFSRRQRRARSLFVVCAGRVTIIGIGLALVSPIGIAASGEDMGIMGQPIEQSGGKLFVGKDLDPLGERQIGSDDCGTPLVTPSQQIQQQLSGGVLEWDQAYDRRADEISLDEVEKISIVNTTYIKFNDE
jgi:hypothetical protein